MSFGKVLVIGAVVMFTVIGIASMFKGEKGAPPQLPVVATETEPVQEVEQPVAAAAQELALPDADLMDGFFNVGLPKLPVVQTVTYSSKVPWKKGSAAWVSDYASHYGTSRHFIARSLNGERDYDKQNVANGDRFNVFAEDKPLSFHLVVDTSRCRMWVYYWDEETDQRVLVKTYPVGLGRPDERRASGLLTPIGTYKLGDRIAVYRPGKTGIYNEQKIEMMEVFGTRWIPLAEEIGQCTAPAKGFGLHGCPWVKLGEDQWQEDLTGLGTYDSDGCIRLQTDDMEELFSVIITKPTTLYLVKDFHDAQLPGKAEEIG